MRREDERYYRSKLFLLDSDLEEFDRRLRARFPDLCIFEDNQDETLVSFYRTLVEAEYHVMFCETGPGWLRETEARDGPQTGMKDFLFRSDETPWFVLNLSVVKREEFEFLFNWRIDRPEGEFRTLAAAEKGKVPGEFEFRYHRNDAAAKRFLNGVCEIVESFTTNRFDWYNLRTGELLKTVPLVEETD